MYTLEEIDHILANFASLKNISREPANLYEPLDYMMSIGGKRIRPKLCLLTYNLFSDDMRNPIILPAMALEVFHEFTLIHDDIMDRSDTRRGCPTVYKKWNENVAILSGDAMSILSYQYLAHAPEAVLPRVLGLFSSTAIQVCEGQQYDMDFENAPFITMDDYLAMIGLKTAVLIACSAKMGALIGGATEPVCKALYDFGYQLGLAFQITDDYLDTFGDEMVFGKKIGGDIANNKKTWLLVECFRRADAGQKQYLMDLLQTEPASRSEKFEKVKALYGQLGIKEAAEEAIESYHRKAIEALAGACLAPDSARMLLQFADQLIHREK